MQLNNRPNKVQKYNKLGWKGLAVTNTLVSFGPFISYDENEVCEDGPYTLK
jgi:hypothetical protein